MLPSPIPDSIEDVQFVLPADVVIVPVSTLAPSVRRGISCDAGDFAISRPRMRRPSKVVDPATAGLLHEFRQPITILDAVLRFSFASAASAPDTLEAAFAALQSLIAGDLLVPAGSPAADAVTASFTAGMRLGDLEIVRLINSLDDTELYEALAPNGIRIALKLLRPDCSADALAALVRETEITRLLPPPHFAQVHSSGVLEGRPYLALFWVDGVRLDIAAARLRCAGRSALTALRRLCADLLSAFALLHERGVVHADVHPGNVLVRPDGSVCVLDFGRARYNNQSPPRAGLYPYYEPELAAALLAEQLPPPPTPLGEQYALAALVYSLLTGAHYRDFALDSPTLLRQVVQDPPLPFISRGVPSWLAVESALARALRKDPELRFASVRHFQRALSAPRPPRHLQIAPLSLADIDFTSPAFANPDSVGADVNSVVWYLLRAALLRGNPHALALADSWAEKHHAAPFLRALIADARMDTHGWSRAVSAFLAATAQPPLSWDLLGGRSGDLLAASHLLEVQQHEPLDQWARATALAIPFNSPHEGLAHGDAGRAYAVLSVGLKPACLPELAARPLPAISSWCRGTAGLTHLWARANTAPAIGEQAALHTYRHDDGNPTLCCGLIGRAFALLAWHRHTGEDIWLRRARQLAHRAAQATTFPAPPLNLRRGTLGLALLQLELESPETATTPPL